MGQDNEAWSFSFLERKIFHKEAKMMLPISYWIFLPKELMKEMILLPLLLIIDLQLMPCGRQLKWKLCIGLKHKQSRNTEKKKKTIKICHHTLQNVFVLMDMCVQVCVLVCVGDYKVFLIKCL